VNDTRLTRAESLIADASKLVTELRDELPSNEVAWTMLLRASDALQRAAGNVSVAIREC